MRCNSVLAGTMTAGRMGRRAAFRASKNGVHCTQGKAPGACIHAAGAVTWRHADAKSAGGAASNCSAAPVSGCSNASRVACKA
jgi:hypothetical protein